MTRERPILFSSPLVRAILDGRKTVTRRIVKLRDGLVGGQVLLDSVHDFSRWCPYGAPGDRMWVRETWAAYTTPNREYGDCDEIECTPAEMPELYGTAAHDVVYQADGTSFPSRWRPSIHMPRWASRLVLEVVSVRVERLQEITPADACAEGAAELLMPGHPLREKVYATHGKWTGNERLDVDGPYAGAVDAFATLWDEIYGDSAPWASNCWVWRVEFRRVEVA